MNQTKAGRYVLAVVLTVALAWPSGAARAQAELGGLSVTKLKVLSPETVPQRKLEAGLLWQMGWYHTRFNYKGKIEDPHIKATAAQMGLRLVAGVFEEKDYGVEFGFTLPVLFQWSKSKLTSDKESAAGLGDVPIGLKFRFLSKRIASLAAAISVTVPTGDEAAGLSEGYTSLAGGLLFSSQPTGWFSIDYNLSAGVTLGIDDVDRDQVPRWGLQNKVGLAWVTAADLALMPCLELAWTMSGTAAGDHKYAHSLLLNFGMNFQLNNRVIMMQGVQAVLAGAQVPRGAMWFMSFTFLT